MVYYKEKITKAYISKTPPNFVPTVANINFPYTYTSKNMWCLSNLLTTASAKKNHEMGFI